MIKKKHNNFKKYFLKLENNLEWDKGQGHYIIILILSPFMLVGFIATLNFNLDFFKKYFFYFCLLQQIHMLVIDWSML